jgi:glutamine amidotransferase
VAAAPVIVDYGMGNIGSVVNAFAMLGADCVVSSEPSTVRDAESLVLPGVGAFAAAMANIRRLGLDAALTEAVIERRTPFLGICLGLQLIARDSIEHGFTEGLGWIDGHVVKMEPEQGLPVPHVGWNDVEISGSRPVFERMGARPHFYFDHTYCLDSTSAAVTATCEYGGRWVAAVQQDNIHAVQFHPEKSQRNGLRLLRNFLNVAVEARC